MEQLRQATPLREVHEAPRPAKVTDGWRVALWAAALAISMGLGPFIWPREAVPHQAPITEASAAEQAVRGRTLEQTALVMRIRYLLQEKRWVDARLLALDCATNHPALDDCQLLLALSTARAHEYETSSAALSRFLNLAPDSVDAPAARELIGLLELAPRPQDHQRHPDHEAAMERVLEKLLH